MNGSWEVKRYRGETWLRIEDAAGGFTCKLNDGEQVEALKAVEILVRMMRRREGKLATYPAARNDGTVAQVTVPGPCPACGRNDHVLCNKARG